MRRFFRLHWKVIVALIGLILVATLFVRPDAAAAATSLTGRLQRHVEAIASSEPVIGTPAALERAAAHIETELGRAGYRFTRQAYLMPGQRVRHIEALLSSGAPGIRSERIFIVGARYRAAYGPPGVNDNGSGMAAVLELARMLSTMQPAAGTEVRFAFFVNEEQPRGMDGERRDGHNPGAGSFIAFVGTLESSARVREALAAFRAASDFPAHGLAAPAHTTGVTLSDHSAYERHGYAALMVTETAFMRYPYYHTAEDPADTLDYEGMARVVTGLAKTIAGLAGTTKG